MRMADSVQEILEKEIRIDNMFDTLALLRSAYDFVTWWFISFNFYCFLF